MNIDHLAICRAALKAAEAENVTSAVRRLHVSVAKNSLVKAGEDLESLENAVVAAESALAVDGVGDR
jgi:hypothetical protein